MSSFPLLATSRRIVGLSAVALALMLGGCSSPDATGLTSPHASATPTAPGGIDIPAGELPDPCSLLTAAQIEAVSEFSFGEGEFNEELSPPWQSICEWFATDDVYTFVQIVIRADASLVAGERETAEAMMGESADVTVPGAEDAYTVFSGSILGMGVDDYFIQVSYMTSSMDDVTAITVALATEVAALF